jgi:hypothetical protein
VVGLALGRPPDRDETLDPDLAAICSEHRVAPFVLETLVSAGRADDPAARFLAAVDLHVRHRYTLAERELGRVLAAAASVGLDPCLLKGIANAERWFPADPSARYASDLDLFVPPDQLGRVDALVDALEPGHRLHGLAAGLMRNGVLPDIPIRGSHVLIELHANPWSLPAPPDALHDLWSRTEHAVTRHGTAIRRLDPTAALLQAIVNSAKDNHAYLLQVVEIARACADPAIDWDRLVATVRRYRWDDVIGDALGWIAGIGAVEPGTIPADALALGGSATGTRLLARIAPRADRLGGLDAWRRAQRFCKLDLAVPGSRAQAILAIAGRTFSPPALIAAYAPDLRGPYPWRAVRYWLRRQQYVKGERATLEG